MDRIKALEGFVAQDPEDGLARFMLGKELLGAGRPAEAVDHLRRAIRLTPDHTASYRWLGNALEQVDHPEEAIEIYRLGLETSERTRDLQTGKEIRVFLSRLQSRLGRPEAPPA
jgi:uncharacterized protein HemY